MMLSTNDLKSMAIYATDGKIGDIEEFYFDTEQWVIRYIIVNSGNFLLRNDVLISPMALSSIDVTKNRIELSLSSEEVEKSPVAASKKTISRKFEKDYYSYFSWPSYWRGTTGPWLIGPYGIPWTHFEPRPEHYEMEKLRSLNERQDKNKRELRSTKEVRRYKIHAIDKTFGHLEALIVDTETWKIQFLEIDTVNYFPSRSVIIPPEWAQSINWTDREIKVALKHKVIKEAPTYSPSRFTNEYIADLTNHYLKNFKKRGKEKQNKDIFTNQHYKSSDYRSQIN